MHTHTLVLAHVATGLTTQLNSTTYVQHAATCILLITDISWLFSVLISSTNNIKLCFHANYHPNWSVVTSNASFLKPTCNKSHTVKLSSIGFS